jgi:hypothetical protein
MGALGSTPLHTVRVQGSQLASATHPDAARAQPSLFTEVFLGALELDARRQAANGDPDGARSVWRTLRALSRELGYRPGADEAAGWLGD